jgi:hypothetical protein
MLALAMRRTFTAGRCCHQCCGDSSKDDSPVWGRRELSGANLQGKRKIVAEACVSRTHRRHQRCRPPVLKTGRVTGPHALPKRRNRRLARASPPCKNYFG